MCPRLAAAWAAFLLAGILALAHLTTDALGAEAGATCHGPDDVWTAMRLCPSGARLEEAVKGAAAEAGRT